MAITYRYIGHATHIFEIAGKTVLVDPFFTNNPVANVKAEEVNPHTILITHGHTDHIEDTVEIATRTKAKVVANNEIINWLQSQGLSEDQTHAQNIGGGYQHIFGNVKLTLAHHSSSLPDGSYGGNPAGILIRAEEKNIYIAGDTALFSDMQLYKGNGVDLFIVPIGDNFTMGPEDALSAVKLLEPKLVIPCHYNTWPAIKQNAEVWANRVEREVKHSKVVVLAPGGKLVLP